MSLIAFLLSPKIVEITSAPYHDNCQNLITNTLFRSLKYLTIYFAQNNFLKFLQRFLTFQMTYSKYSNFIYDSWSSASEAVYYVPSTKIKFWLRDRDNLLFSKGSRTIFEGCLWRCFVQHCLDFSCFPLIFMTSIDLIDMTGRKREKSTPLLWRNKIMEKMYSKIYFAWVLVIKPKTKENNRNRKNDKVNPSHTLGKPINVICLRVGHFVCKTKPFQIFFMKFPPWGFWG